MAAKFSAAIEEAKLAVSEAQTAFDRAKARAYNMAPDIALARFKTPRPSPTTLAQIVNNDPDVCAARERLDASYRALVAARVAEQERANSLEPSIDEADDGLTLAERQMTRVEVPGFEGNVLEYVEAIREQLRTIRENLGRLRQRIDEESGLPGHKYKELWEDVLENSTIYMSLVGEYLDDLREARRLVMRFDAAAAEIKEEITSLRRLEKACDKLNELARIKIKGW